jgi:hypothetical protein
MNNVENFTGWHKSDRDPTLFAIHKLTLDNRVQWVEKYKLRQFETYIMLEEIVM